MGRIIVKLEDYYLEWSSITDSPITFGMGRSEFEDYYLAKYGRNGYRGFKSRMERTDQRGTSSYLHRSAADVVSGNRAGPDECELSLVEVYQAYCLRQPIRGGWLVPEAESDQP